MKQEQPTRSEIDLDLALVATSLQLAPLTYRRLDAAVTALRAELEQVKQARDAAIREVGKVRRELGTAESENKRLREALELATKNSLELVTRLAKLREALEKTVWRFRFDFPTDPYCQLCGVGQKWAKKHGHEKSCIFA